MKLPYLLSALVLPVALSACGLAGAIIGPVEVGDAFGVNGQSLSAQFSQNDQGLSVLSLSSQAVSTATGSAEYSFDDQDLDTRGFSLVDVKAEIGIESVVTLKAPVGASYPESFTLSSVAAQATVGDAVNGSVTLAESRELELAFNKGACGVSSCEYRFSGDVTLLEDALSVGEGDNSVLRSFVKIIKLDGENSANQGSFNVTLGADSDTDLSGFSATFKLINKSTKIRVG